MFSYVFQCFLTFSNVTYSHSHPLSLSHSLTINIYYILLLATINIYYILLLASMFNSQAEEGIFFDISRTLLTSQRTDELELETFGGYISSGLLFIITITFLLVKI